MEDYNRIFHLLLQCVININDQQTLLVCPPLFTRKVLGFLQIMIHSMESDISCLLFFKLSQILNKGICIFPLSTCEYPNMSIYPIPNLYQNGSSLYGFL